jgi:hypothetical protein
MLQRRLIGATFFSGKLAGAFIELRRHLRRFAGGTTERDEDLGKLGGFHARILTTDRRRCTQIKKGAE